MAGCGRTLEGDATLGTEREGSAPMSFRFFRMYLKVPVVLLALIEAALFIFAPYQAAALRFGSAVADNVTPTGQLWPTAVLFSAVTVLSLFAMGLYTTRQRSTRTGMVLRIVAGVLNAAALSALLYYLVPNLEIGRGMLALTAGVAIAGSMIVRLLFERIVDEDLFKRRVLVYGAGQASHAACSSCVDARTSAVSGSSASSPPKATRCIAPTSESMPRPDDLYRWAIEHSIDEIVDGDGRPASRLPDARVAGMPAGRHRNPRVAELPRARDRQGAARRAEPELDHLRRGFPCVADPAACSNAAFDVAREPWPAADRRMPFMLLAAIGIKLEEGLQRAAALSAAARRLTMAACSTC